MTAVVRGSTGEPVILLSGKSNPIDSENRSEDLVKAASAVLDSDELRMFKTAIGNLSASWPHVHVAADGAVLVVYKVTEML
ncbi:hypothetical protein ABZ464_27765 [Streptomyces sp. NPDC005820]|uniref:hypothetical protein n=1 Tax=Streptomyces sp. NPDC005820 TaxID=3157069 RepID=UPI00340A7515